MTVAWVQELEGSIRSQPAGDTTEGPYSTRYSPAMRYYRCAQVAANSVAAFQNLYLAFEYLAAKRVPRKEGEDEGEWEDERTWLQRAIEELLMQYPDSVRDELDPKAKGKHFYTRIYEAVRCATFHAKPYKNPVAPFDEREEQVREAYRLLFPHVRELLRTASDWPEGHHILSDEEMQGEMVVDLGSVAFLLPKDASPPARQYEGHAWDEGGKLPRIYGISTRLDPDHADHVRGMKWNLGPIPVRHKFRVFPKTDVPMDVAVRLVASARFEGHMRSPRSPLDHIAPLRSATKMKHRLLRGGTGT